MGMENLRRYGRAPFKVAVIHGGPGAPGEMAPVARELSQVTGILEPLQMATTVAGQIEELHVLLQENAGLPVTLIGFSWGAMLSFIFAAQHPRLVKKLVLVSSGPYEEKYALGITQTRLSRLEGEDRKGAIRLSEALDGPATAGKNAIMSRLGELIAKADSYDPMPTDSGPVECQYEVYQGVWEQASELRRSRRLLGLGKGVRCAVVAIHGDYDPHPAEGVREPLSRILEDFRFILLERCGHRPWIERNARDEFYRILVQEMRD